MKMANTRFAEAPESLRSFTRHISENPFTRHISENHFTRHISENSLRGISPRTLLRGISPRTLLRGISPRTLLRGISPRTLLRGIYPRTLLRGISPRTLYAAYLREPIPLYKHQLRMLRHCPCARISHHVIFPPNTVTCTLTILQFTPAILNLVFTDP